MWPEEVGRRRSADPEGLEALAALREAAALQPSGLMREPMQRPKRRSAPRVGEERCHEHL